MCDQVPDLTSCTRYTLCMNGVQLPRECAPGTAFDRVNRRCDIAENVVCEADTCANLEGGTGIAPSPEGCKHLTLFSS